MNTRKLKLFYALITFLIIFIVLKQGSIVYEDKIEEQDNKVIYSQLKTNSLTIQESIKQRLITLSLLSEYLKDKHLHGESINLEDIELLHFTQTLYKSTSGIKVFQISPKGVHKFVYPLKGNEKTLNKNIFKDKRPNVIKALELNLQTNDIVANEPYKLIQGGFGMVFRQAIYKNNNFWGLVIMIVDMNKILNTTDFINNKNNLELAITKDNKTLFGNTNTLGKEHNTYEFKILNQKLEIIGSKKSSLKETSLILINLAIFFISFLTSLIVFILLNRQVRLEQSIDKAYIKLKNKNRELALLIEEAPNPIMLLNKEGEVLIVNKEWRDITGYSSDEIKDISSWIEKAYHTEGEKFKRYIDLLFTRDKKTNEGEYTIFTKAGEKRIWKFTSTPFEKINNIQTIISSAMDITDIKEKEKIILQQNKMASLGEMLENIAHQWRQPLSAISTASTGILFEEEAGVLKKENLKKSMHAINHASQYLSTTIDYFREFIIENDDKQVINLKDTIERTLNILSSKLKNRDITIITNLEDINYKCIENELIQIIMNFISNAQDALEKSEKERFIFIDTFLEDSSIKIIIKDTAGGIDENVIKKIFEPYFTTKHQSQGTGIGLYMTEDIIINHLNGNIEVINESFIYKENKYIGAKFLITLPYEE